MNYSHKLEFDKIINTIKKYTYTPYANVLLDNLLPSNDYNKVLRINSQTNEARVLTFKYENLSFLCLNDIKELIDKLKHNVIINQFDLLEIFILIKNSRETINYYKSLKEKEEIIHLKEYFTNINKLDNLYKRINSIIDDNAEIIDSASEYLYSIRTNLKNHNLDIRNKLLDIISSKSSYLSETVIVLRNDRMCLCVKESHKNQIKGTIHDQSSSGNTYYIEPSIVSTLYAKINHLLLEESDEIKKILRKISNEIFEEYNEITQNFYILSNLDVIFAKAKYAINIDGYLINIKNNKEINLIKARHPLIKKEDVIPIDVNLGKTHDAIIITGPNTGGKTVVLKTVGLLTLMMQSGILVPADDNSTLSIFDNVFVDIGDSQSIEQSLSTFSSHMTNIINIVNNSTDKSLILLDELGSGTDPNEGSLLAISIIDELLIRDVRMIATTHYANLKSYAYNKDKVINASVEFDIKTLKPTYKLLLGIPGMSNAINISKNLGLNENIINNAINLANAKNNDTDNLMNKLEYKNLELLEKEKEYNFLLEEVNKEKLSYENKLLDIKKEQINLITKAKQEAENILQKARDDSKKLIEKLDEMKSNEIKEHQIAALKNEANNLKIKKEIKKEISTFEVGELVSIDEYDRTGTIKSIKNNKHIIKIGNIEMSFKAEELSKTKKIEQPKVTKKKNYTPKMTKTAKLELDLRGYRYEEVSYTIDKFIDDAYMAGLNQINIIHGFGSGAVRNATQEYLKKCSYVKETRFGGEFEGGNGVTVVYLK
ncbi:MAG: endonuclease MutS2 [bacterium]